MIVWMIMESLRNRCCVSKCHIMRRGDNRKLRCEFVLIIILWGWGRLDVVYAEFFVGWKLTDVGRKENGV